MQKEFSIIGNRIKALRVGSGMKQSELAKKIGMSQTNLSNVESGRTAVTVQVLLKIHDVLGCKLADFFVDLDNDVEEAAREEQSAKQSIELEEAVQILKLLKAVKIKGL